MNPKAELFIDSRCELGEGPLWHPGLGRLFWFDILNCTLFSATEDGQLVDRFIFKDNVSAAAIIDDNTLAVAQAGALLRLDLTSDTHTEITPIDANRPGNRTNDGRVNPAGGFWIGTMSRRGGQDIDAGSVYQYRAGQMTTVIDKVTIPNATCFSPDGRTAYFTNMTGVIVKCPIDPDTGLPIGEWTEFSKIDGVGGGPDGAIVDSEGFLWSARWGGSAVVRIAPDGRLDRVVELPVSQASCPALGGADLKTLYITTAREHMTPEQLAMEPMAGSVFSIRVDVPGLPEARLKL